MLVPIGGGGGALAAASRLGIHWHVASKVEYVASDPDRQNITWVRSVDPEDRRGEGVHILGASTERGGCR